MHQRQRFWSRTHGFQLGRKLGDWTAAERREAETIVIEEEEDKEPVGEELFVETTRGVDSLEEGKDGGLEGAIRSSIENGLAPRGGPLEQGGPGDACRSGGGGQTSLESNVAKQGTRALPPGVPASSIRAWPSRSPAGRSTSLLLISVPAGLSPPLSTRPGR